MTDDASIEHALERAIEDNNLAAGGDARILLDSIPHLRRVFHDDGDVARLLDAISPPVSDLDDEQVLERPALLAMVIVRALGATSWEEATVLGAAVITPGHGGDDGGGGDGAAKKGCSGCGGGGVTGVEVAERPCERGHGYHPDCINEWFGCSNMCALCRHPLPTSCVDGQ